MAIQAKLLNKTEIAYAHSKMLANVAAAGGKTTLGLALYPPYPHGSFSYGMVRPFVWLSVIRVNGACRIGHAIALYSLHRKIAL